MKPRGAAAGTGDGTAEGVSLGLASRQSRKAQLTSSQSLAGPMQEPSKHRPQPSPGPRVSLHIYSSWPGRYLKQAMIMGFTPTRCKIRRLTLHVRCNVKGINLTELRDDENEVLNEICLGSSVL